MSKSTAEIRQAFLDFFRSKGHQVVSGSALVPVNDTTLLFTNAGMNQFKNIFLGLEQSAYSRATTAQRCVRAGGKHNDLDNVGYTARHHTFFEMLGNFSFGDYFKRDAIHFAWELLTDKNWFNLPKEKLWVTVYETDHEAYAIWAQHVGIPEERIIRIGDKGEAYASDNFWQMGDTGPCGPCTEIFYDHGDTIWGGPPGSPEENGDRYIEIWNLVFMQFNRQPDGTLLPLPQPSVDTGMGLERISAVLQQVNSNYDIDLFRDLMAAIAKVTGVTDLRSHSLRVIADHIRSCAFLIADGVMPSNEHRGYVLRRILRRAVRHGYLLGVKNTFFYKLVAPLISVMGSAADELKRHQLAIEQILKTEEEQFSRTLERGLMLLDEALSQLTGNVLDGETAFRLYDTFGFPLDLTADICRERNLSVDEAGFELAMEAQRQRARKSGNFSIDHNSMLRTDKVSQFCGYDHRQHQATVTAIFRNGEQVNEVFSGENAIVILDKTPFYGESGGQAGDTGELKNITAHFNVLDTQRYGLAIGHLGKLVQGRLRVLDTVDASIASPRRSRIQLNHSATHLLHAALRQILGEHVAQKGSMVSDTGLRFDFSHFEAMKPEQIRQTEMLVNTQIRHNLPINTEIMTLDAARKKGAMALFGEKYDDAVRVLTMGTFSSELCGGTHATRTGDIGAFWITSESASAAGIRRIEAVTGENAVVMFHQQSDLLHDIAHLVKSDNKTLADKICMLLERNKVLERELTQLKYQRAAQKSLFLSKKAKDINGVKVLISELINTEPEMLRSIVDELKNRLGSAIIVLATATDDKVHLIAGVTQNLTSLVKAGELIAVIAQQVGGKGGGRPDLAQAGGSNVKNLPSALGNAEAWIVAKL